MLDQYIIMPMHGINNQNINNGVNETTTTTHGCRNVVPNLMDILVGIT